MKRGVGILGAVLLHLFLAQAAQAEDFCTDANDASVVSTKTCDPGKVISLCRKINVFNGANGQPRECRERIDFAAGKSFNIPIPILSLNIEVGPVSYNDYGQEVQNDLNGDGKNLIFDGSKAQSVVLNGLNVNPPEGQCVFNINITDSLFKNFTVKAKDIKKALCTMPSNKFENVWVEDASGKKVQLNSEGKLPQEPPPPPPPPPPDEDEGAINDEASFDPPSDEEEPVIEEEAADAEGYTTIVVVDYGVPIDPVVEARDEAWGYGGLIADAADAANNGGANNGNADNNGGASDDASEPPASASKDDDGDGIPNGVDNCPMEPNADQADGNKNGLGNVCDPDYKPADEDGDSFANEIDNCPLEPNIEQIDSDADGLGDACDQDFSKVPDDLDGDGVKDDADNCVNVANPDQLDYDQDAAGNACDMTPGEAPPAPAPMIDPGIAEGQGDPAVDDGVEPKADEPFLKCTMSLSPAHSSQGLNLGLLSLLLPIGVLLSLRASPVGERGNPTA
ncbi:MAG: thrombospondin type 3 repeat-containing protein [Deltaproteobacteria bacterium]|nr:thrombospondin type 3 repeat-containing protein [Deltaproteobacteria bacterium]